VKALLSGNEAIARGAYEAGCHFAASYPGTPATEILESIAKYKEIRAEWSTNEKVALEVASGASIAGARTIVSMKHVGLNVAADPLFTLSYLGVNGGLVIVTADDPECHSSQNEQDNRQYGRAAKVPVLEPSDSQEAKDFTKLAFDISEEFDTPVIVRITTRIAHSFSPVELEDRIEHKIKGYTKNIEKYLCLPAHARKRRYFVEERLKKLAQYGETAPINRIEWGDKKLGIITCGIAYQYVKEVFPQASVLKIGMVYPIPPNLIRNFIEEIEKNSGEVYVVEERDPFLESEIKFLGFKVKGKEKVPVIGELNQAILRNSFTHTPPGPSPRPHLPGRPPVLCPGCPHRGVFYVIKRLRLHATGDIGCYTLGALPPLNAMDTCLCMGASISQAWGMEAVLGDEIASKLVACIGDSTFLHSGITPLIDLVYNKGRTTVIILDNRTTAMTGHQPHPGTGFTAKGEEGRLIKLEEIARACGVNRVKIVDPYNLKEVEETLKEEVATDEPSVIIARRPCALRTKPEAPFYVDAEKCNSCKVCLGLGCPAIIWKDGKAYIDELLCNGCSLCQQVCKFEAIVRKSEG